MFGRNHRHRRLLTSASTLLVVGLAAVTSAPVAAQATEAAELSSVTVQVGNASLPLDGSTPLQISGTMSDGATADLDEAYISVSSSKPTVAAASIEGASGNVQAGTVTPGETTLTATVTLRGTTATGHLDVTVLPEPARPFRHDYHQTLTMKMFMADNKGRVSLTFEQALEVIRKVDNLTRGIPKIYYLVGWQYDGHDTGYPAWDVVNPKLKRPQDETALESLRWLIQEARQYNTTVSFHINMLDASAASPLWDTYRKADVIARNKDGSLREYVWGHPISYTLEWEAGLTQKRIDKLFEMVDMTEIGTVHVDAFHQYIPGYGTEPISPYHGITTDQEVATQKKIMRYWRDRGVDVTSEFAYSYRKDPLLGLQPMSWHFRGVDQMKIPPTLHIGGAGGDARFGTSMQGESIIKRDPAKLGGFLDEFARTTLVWYYLNRLDRLSDTGGVVTFSDDVTSRYVDGRLRITRGDLVLRDGDDVFTPALWNNRHREIVAYSADGYHARTWRLPADWHGVGAVDVYRIGLDGLTRIQRQAKVTDGRITLSLPAGTAVSIVPAHTDVGEADTSGPHAFAARAPKDNDVSVPPAHVRFQWTPSYQADRYRLIVAEDERFQSVVVYQTTTDTALVVPRLEPGTVYHWKVDATTTATGGSITVDGAPLTFRTAVTEPPAQPAGVTAYRMSDDSVFVAWHAVPGAATYAVQRRAAGSAFTTIADGVTGSSYLDPTASRSNGPFEYRVVGVNALGAGEPSAAAVEAAVDLSSAVYLSDLNWESASVGWGTIGRDKAISGGNIRLGGTRYDKGLGVHATSAVVYRLGASDRLFRAVIGVDDAKRGSPATVVFRVYGDGELLYDSDVMRGEPYSTPQQVLVDVSGHDTLRLEVSDAGDGINSDHADWANAQLLSFTS
ncbi:NPCBM/NEW2 domain-containing protein [Micromonospora sp. NPDC047738]|uniref:NPCBM/NEW2 domain-containing protein n=1 Tax=Micromonospora sp. NPDC047738 TaxID=3155741 RepID=UPI0033C3700B